MSRCLSALLLLTFAGAGCGAPMTDEEIASALAGDSDGDGILDSVEAALMARFSPTVRLAPDGTDWTRPANVDWYLPKVHMRFNHTGCPDHQVLGDGTVTQANLSTQRHPTDNFICAHTSTIYASGGAHAGFFLQPTDTTIWSGTAPSGWRTYVHVKRSSLVSGGYDVQYWFFYAYDDGPARFDHEGDWEHVTITADADQRFYSAWYAQHNSGVRYAASQLQFVNGTHPVVYSAVGTHASYPSAGNFNVTLGFTDRTSDGGPSYDTASNQVNVGEKSAPLGGQSFIEFGGGWGEIGSTSFSTGPLTPSFQATWDTY